MSRDYVDERRALIRDVIDARRDRGDVVAEIARTDWPAGVKRAAFAEWLLFRGEPIRDGVLDEVIGHPARFAPGAAWRPACRR